MVKHSSVIFSFLLGLVLCLVGCSKDNHDTLAFVGDELDMKTCYQIYPEQYFPTDDINPDLMDGRFPPDVTGEYEIHGILQDGSYATYSQSQHQYVTVQLNAYREKYLYIIIEDQVNGMANMRFAIKTSIGSNYNKWYEVQAYIYGNVYSENPGEFMICFENKEAPTGGMFRSHIGSIIKGKIESQGVIGDIDYWTIYKKVEYTTLTQGIPKEGGHAHYQAEMVQRAE